MDYEKKYNEAMLRADEAVQKGCLDKDMFDIIFPPEESEDERIRKQLINICNEWLGGGHSARPCLNDVRWLKNLLEKQKENPKFADFISADCVSDAKCEDRWHKTANSLPDSGRDVLAKDALGNYLLASFDGAQWFVSVYDGQDHPVLHTPPILEWCDIPSEKQKEQKPAWSEVELLFRGEKVTVKRPFYRDDKGRGYSTTEQDEEVAWNALRAWCEKKGISLYDLYPKVEWSEEDETIIEGACNALEIHGHTKLASMLKFLRPSWKPSEEQMHTLEEVINNVKQGIRPYASEIDHLEELREELKKL